MQVPLQCASHEVNTGWPTGGGKQGRCERQSKTEKPGTKLVHGELVKIETKDDGDICSIKFKKIQDGFNILSARLHHE